MLSIDKLQETLNKVNDSLIKSQVYVVVNPYLLEILLSKNDNNELKFDYRNNYYYYNNIRITCNYDLTKNEVLIKKLGSLDYERIEIEYVDSKRQRWFN